MDFQKYTLIFIFAAGAILGGAVGYGTGFSKGIKQTPTLPLPFSPSSELFSLSGIVKEIRGNILVMDARLFSGSGEVILAPREVIITERTNIQKAQLKSPDELIAELREFQKRAAQGEAQTPAPPVKITGTITFSDIHEGEEIIVESDENIKGKTRFEATRVILPTF